MTRAPRSKVAPAALVELTAARALFSKAAPFGGRAVKMLVRVSFYQLCLAFSTSSNVVFPLCAVAYTRETARESPG